MTEELIDPTKGGSLFRMMKDAIDGKEITLPDVSSTGAGSESNPLSTESLSGGHSNSSSSDTYSHYSSAQRAAKPKRKRKKAAGLTATISKVHPPRTGNYSTYIRVELIAADGSWFKTDIAPSFRNYKYWCDYLRAGTTLSGLRLKDSRTVDADSRPKFVGFSDVPTSTHSSEEGSDD